MYKSKKVPKVIATLLLLAMLIPNTALAAEKVTQNEIDYKGITITETITTDYNGEVSTVYGLAENCVPNPSAKALLVEYIQQKQTTPAITSSAKAAYFMQETFKLSYGDPIYDSQALESSSLTWQQEASSTRNLTLSGIRKLYGYNNHSPAIYTNRRIGIQEIIQFSKIGPALSIAWPSSLSAGVDSSNMLYTSAEKITTLSSTEFGASHQFSGTTITATGGIAGSITGTYTGLITAYYGTTGRDISDDYSATAN